MLNLQNFKLASVSGSIEQSTPLAPLDLLVGTWKGTGFNQIWRPFHGKQGHFLELNETIETLTFDEIPGNIPNRGLLQEDINLRGVNYLQSIQDANVRDPDGNLVGIHLEPGLWLTVPATSNPQDAKTVARLANIPHGTALVAQGATLPTQKGGPEIKPVDITAFQIGQPKELIPFPESNLSIPTAFRTPKKDIPGVTQLMVDNPNSVLEQANVGKTILSTTTLNVSTTPLNPPSTGGGTANIAFLQGAAGGPNANAVQMDATFWIETIVEDGKTIHQLQYTQTVILDFAGLSWPHVSVATLIKQ